MNEIEKIRCIRCKVYHTQNKFSKKRCENYQKTCDRCLLISKSAKQVREAYRKLQKGKEDLKKCEENYQKKIDEIISSGYI